MEKRGSANIPLVEIKPVRDIVVSGIGRIERLTGGVARVIFYVEQMDGPDTVHVVAAKIVRPVSTWSQSLRMIATAMGNPDLPYVADCGTIKPFH